MSLTLHFHPLSSFCWKVLMAQARPCFARVLREAEPYLPCSRGET